MISTSTKMRVAAPVMTVQYQLQVRHETVDVPAEAVYKRHDFLSSELEAFGRTVFWKVLDLFFRKKNLQSCAKTLGLRTEK